MVAALLYGNAKITHLSGCEKWNFCLLSAHAIGFQKKVFYQFKKGVRKLTKHDRKLGQSSSYCL